MTTPTRKLRRFFFRTLDDFIEGRDVDGTFRRSKKHRKSDCFYLLIPGAPDCGAYVRFDPDRGPARGDGLRQLIEGAA